MSIMLSNTLCLEDLRTNEICGRIRSFQESVERLGEDDQVLGAFPQSGGLLRRTLVVKLDWNESQFDVLSTLMSRGRPFALVRDNRWYTVYVAECSSSYANPDVVFGVTLQGYPLENPQIPDDCPVYRVVSSERTVVRPFPRMIPSSLSTTISTSTSFSTLLPVPNVPVQVVGDEKREESPPDEFPVEVSCTGQGRLFVDPEEG